MLRDTFKCKLRIKQSSFSGDRKINFEDKKDDSNVEAGLIEIYQINSKYTISGPVILA